METIDKINEIIDYPIKTSKEGNYFLDKNNNEFFISHKEVDELVNVTYTKSNWVGPKQGQGTKGNNFRPAIINEQAIRENTTYEELNKYLIDEQIKSRKIIEKLLPYNIEYRDEEITDRNKCLTFLTGEQQCHINPDGPKIPNNLRIAQRWENMLKDARPKLYALLKKDRLILEFVQIYVCYINGYRWIHDLI